MAKKDTAQDLGLTVKKDEDFSEWYTQVILKSGLADYGPVKGCMVIRPWGYAVWENIQSWLDKQIKATGHKNAYFPLFIPEGLLKTEEAHVEGFVPEVAWITHGGEKKLEERLAIRPTSETIMYSMYAQWIRSHRDLPLLINQWCNVVRWETKATRLFLRTREFLWQEGHTVHTDKKGADVEVKKMLDVYVDLAESQLAIPVITGKKTEAEKFPGALYTTTIEALMADGKSLQMGTSHNLGQNFAKAFKIVFKDENEKDQYAWQTSWGVSTRLIGAVIMSHGDDKGLVLPPNIAPTKVVIIPILFDKTKKQVLAKSKEIMKDLEEKGISVELDDREEYKAGFKFNEWELKGVPLRIEIGPKDIEKNKVVLARRDTGEKTDAEIKTATNAVEKLLNNIQKDMLKKSKEFLNKNTYNAKDYKDLRSLTKSQKGMVRAFFCGDENCEENIKEETGATTRCFPFNEDKKGKCIKCGKEGKLILFAKAY